jgi:hypothetical protein
LRKAIAPSAAEIPRFGVLASTREAGGGGKGGAGDGAAGSSGSGGATSNGGHDGRLRHMPKSERLLHPVRHVLSARRVPHLSETRWGTCGIGRQQW